MRQLFIVILISISTSLLAQTKEIAFKSHSGNMANFNIALNNGLFNSEESNFGLPSEKITYRLDSVIYLSDSVSVLVTTEYRQPFNGKGNSAKRWGMKKDTLYKDPLFGRKHSLDSIKTILKTGGQYVNPVNKMVFIGFDNKKSKKNIILPVSFKNDDNNNLPFDRKIFLMLGAILVLSLLGGWFSWKYCQLQLQKA